MPRPRLTERGVAVCMHRPDADYNRGLTELERWSWESLGEITCTVHIGDPWHTHGAINRPTSSHSVAVHSQPVNLPEVAKTFPYPSLSGELPPPLLSLNFLQIVIMLLCGIYADIGMVSILTRIGLRYGRDVSSSAHFAGG